MCQFIGVDVSCQSISEGRGIDGGDDEEILMHIYQLIKGRQRRRGFTFPAVLHRSCLPLKNPPLFSRERLIFFVFHILAIPPSLYLQPFASELRFLPQEEVRSGLPARSSAVT